MKKHITAQDAAIKYIAYPKAMRLLFDRPQDDITPEELAAWIFIGPDEGGLAAFTNANELTPPPRFAFHPDMGEDYVSPLIACWFREEEVANFEPVDRFITGKELIERWRGKLGITQPEIYIQAKIAESRLLDIHPTQGTTRGSFPGNDTFPPLDSGIFVLAHVEEIEAFDFGEEPLGREEGVIPQQQGVVAKLLFKHFDFWELSRWNDLTSKPRPWIQTARVGAVAPRKAAYWNPAFVANCLWAYKLKYRNASNKNWQKHARSIPSETQLKKIIQVHFPDWLKDLQFDLD